LRLLSTDRKPKGPNWRHACEAGRRSGSIGDGTNLDGGLDRSLVSFPTHTKLSVLVTGTRIVPDDGQTVYSNHQAFSPERPAFFRLEGRLTGKLMVDGGYLARGLYSWPYSTEILEYFDKKEYVIEHS
jgi:hypothetical protein